MAAKDNRKQRRMDIIIEVLIAISILLMAAGVIGMVAVEGGTDTFNRAYAAFMLGMYLSAFSWGYELGRKLYKKKDKE